jgi:Endoplasmic reticulum vesicle transporter/Endoplasmic Reticulum-Golgi Intermediate Compartment (ERGIC)
MNFLGSKLARFDVHSKAVDGVNQQTAIGAFVTIIMYSFITFLLYSEINMRAKSNLVSKMELVESGSSRRISTTKIVFDVEFYKISCDRITFAQEITRGEYHNSTANVNKIPLNPTDLTSCKVHGSLVTDKVGGNFRFEIAALKAEVKVKSLTDTDSTPEEANLQQLEFDQTPPDISHKLNRIVFIEHDVDDSPEEAAPDVASNIFLGLESHPLNGQESSLPLGVGIHQYAIQVVPTTYRPSVGKAKLINQYSVTERQVDFMQALTGVTVAGQFFSDFVGIVFTYDFYPVSYSFFHIFRLHFVFRSATLMHLMFDIQIQLVMQEERIASGGMVDYITTLCGIIGGVITVLG